MSDERKIIGWLTLKDLPSQEGVIPAFTEGMNNGTSGHVGLNVKFPHGYCFSHEFALALPQFFLLGKITRILASAVIVKK
jgi:hypothetical protein